MFVLSTSPYNILTVRWKKYLVPRTCMVELLGRQDILKWSSFWDWDVPPITGNVRNFNCLVFKTWIKSNLSKKMLVVWLIVWITFFKIMRQINLPNRVDWFWAWNTKNSLEMFFSGNLQRLRMLPQLYTFSETAIRKACFSDGNSFYALEEASPIELFR